MCILWSLWLNCARNHCSSRHRSRSSRVVTPSRERRSQSLPFRGMGKYRFFSFAGLFRFKITIRQSQIRVTAFPPIFRLMLLHDIECVLNFLSGSKTKIVCQKLFCVNFSLRQKCALLSRPVHNSFFGGSWPLNLSLKLSNDLFYDKFSKAEKF